MRLPQRPNTGSSLAHAITKVSPVVSQLPYDETMIASPYPGGASFVATTHDYSHDGHGHSTEVQTLLAGEQVTEAQTMLAHEQTGVQSLLTGEQTTMHCGDSTLCQTQLSPSIGHKPHKRLIEVEKTLLVPGVYCTRTNTSLNIPVSNLSDR